MSDAPERIWLARAWANTFTTYDDREQCCEYVREDLHTALQARLAELEAERDEALNQLDSSRHSVEVLERRVAAALAAMEGRGWVTSR